MTCEGGDVAKSGKGREGVNQNSTQTLFPEAATLQKAIASVSLFTVVVYNGAFPIAFAPKVFCPPACNDVHCEIVKS